MKEATATANPATNDGETDTAEEAGAGAGDSAAANEPPTSEKNMATTTNNGTTEAAERETAAIDPKVQVLNMERSGTISLDLGGGG